MTEKRDHTIDATGKRLGRFASAIAHTLLGKDTTSFAKNTVASVVVTVENVDALEISDKKKETKIYDRYSGFHGGRKEETLEELIAKKGVAEALKKAVHNMLPNNRLRKARMKNLIIK
ncbi:50S ribosomal protein L13 [Candidatus Kaiserbacteria bacterium]|nr:MAG: 50S ribosomal protein L13 [Candidatus Kaiserbacteria bacterium]PCI90490.1 MAG: 50S ribosomal protein L13 [Candidatus Kaiserbacteria bacterium]